jgi:hypothetical protein
MPYPHLRHVIRLAALLALVLSAAPVAGQGLSLGLPPDPESANIAVVVDPGLRKTKHLPGAALRRDRVALLAGKTLSDVQLRALADRRDGLAAWRLVKPLRAANAPAIDIAHYAGIAAAQGRVYALDDMIDAMARLKPGDVPSGRLRPLVQVLYAHAWAGNSLALDAVIAFNGEGRLLGPLSEATRARILQQGAHLDGRIELRLALDLLGQDTPGEPDRARALGYLERAIQSENPAVRATAQNVIALLVAAPVQSGAATN